MAVRTRFLVMSDTHSERLDILPKREHPIDVVVHCGDFTEECNIWQVRETIAYLQTFDAPLKLIIAGNHEWTFDASAYEQIIARSQVSEDMDQVRRWFGKQGEARALFESEEAQKAGIVFLDEGVHQFQLANGGQLKVFASPYTPCMGTGLWSSESDWAFQYDRRKGHSWSIPDDVDLVITHGPPLGVLDRTPEGRAGDKDLFAAVARAQPQLHCFGHIHHEWGAKRVRWRHRISDEPSFFVDIDGEHSSTIENLAGIEPRRHDNPVTTQAKSQRLRGYRKQGFCSTGEPPQSGNGVNETLFINAAIEGEEVGLQHLPWIAELNLRSSEVEDSQYTL